MPESKKVVVRFAPSPTGPLHVGGARSALYNYLFAKKNNGKLILRIEDTDTLRSKKEYEEDIYESFKWLGITFDETYRQSDRGEIYKKYLQTLVDNGKAFISKEDAPEGGRTEVIRFKNPNIKVSWNDLIKGEISFDTTELKDFVIAKSLTEPLYHLAVVVDDFEMGITHIIRGEDHISNTPRQILLGRALGFSQPLHAHIPLILAEDRSKLSKRKHGESVSVFFYRNAGYLPEALTNYLALLGWNAKDDRELFTTEELISLFSLEGVHKGGAIFSRTKLDWMNKEYLLKKIAANPAFDPKDHLPKEVTEGKSEVQIKLLFQTLLERVSRLKEITELFEKGDYKYLIAKPTYQKENLYWKKDPDQTKTKNRLEQVKIKLESLDENSFEKETVKNALWDYATKEGRGEVLWPLRFCLSGQYQSPDPFTLSAILGKDETLHRIKNAIDLL